MHLEIRWFLFHTTESDARMYIHHSDSQKQLMPFPELLIRFLHLEQVILVSDAVRVTRSTQTCLKVSYMFSCVFFMALAAKPMFLRTSVLVLAFSRASLWNSMVDNVPSIRFSCSSYRFFLFRAWRATMTKEKEVNMANSQRLLYYYIYLNM